MDICQCENILVEEAYTGVLNNHRREYNNGKTKHIDKTDWYRHEGFFPVIIGNRNGSRYRRYSSGRPAPQTAIRPSTVTRGY